MLKRKDKILISAIELLGKEGITGLTIKNLARSQSVTEPALYRQYKNKQEIINHIIKEYKGYDEQIQETISQSYLSGKEAILFYVERYAELYENYVELTTVMLSMDLYFYNEHTRKEMYGIRMNRSSFLQGLISVYIKDSVQRLKLDADELCTCIEGIMTAEILNWRLSGESYSLKNRINDIVEKIL